MKRTALLYCLSGFILIISLSTSTPESRSNQKFKSDISVFTDSIWKVKPIVKLGDPAPSSGGTFLEFGRYNYLENGTFVFGARYGNKKYKDWALYSYKNGTVSHVFSSYEKYSEPDGIQKEFESAATYYDPQLSTNFSYTPEFRARLIYITGKTKNGEKPSYIYAWDGEKILKILCEGDKISLPGNREVIIDDAMFEYSTNNGEAVIWFKGQKPDKISGWLLHDGKTLKPLFITGDELPGLPGVIVDELDGKSVYVFNDTILANLRVSGAPYKLAVLKFSKNKTEIVDSSSKINHGLCVLNAAGSENVIIQNGESILQFNKGNRNIIVTNLKDLTELQDVKGAVAYKVNGSAFAGTQNDGIIFSISLIAGTGNYDVFSGWSGIETDRLPGLFFFKDNKLSLLPESKLYFHNNKSKKLSSGSAFIPFPYYVKTVPKVNGVFLYNLPFTKEEFFQVTRYLDPSGIVPDIVKTPDLKTEGLIRFSLSDIIAWPAENKIIAKSILGGVTDGFYELTK